MADCRTSGTPRGARGVFRWLWPPPGSGPGAGDRAAALAAWGGAATLAAGAVLAAVAPPGWRLWGLDGLAMLPPAARWLGVAAALAAGLVVAAGAAAADRREAAGGRAAAVRPALAALGLLLLCTLVLPAGTALRGDGQTLLTSLQTPDLGSRSLPGTSTLLLDRLLTALTGSGRVHGLLAPTAAFRLLDACAAVAYGLALWLIARRFAGAGARLFAILAGGLCGVLPALAGLVELYAPALAAVALALAVGAREISRGRRPWGGLGLALLAAALHVVAICVLPAFGMALGRRRSVRTGWTVLAACAAAGLAGALAVGRAHLLAPLGPAAADGYALASGAHLLDLANLAAWSAPLLVAIVLPVRLALGRRRLVAARSPDHAGAFLLAACLGPLAFALVFAPELGMARDADLLTLPAVPLTFFALWRLPVALPGAAALAGAAACAGLLTVGSQVALQHAPARAVARFERQLARDPGRSAYGWEMLAIHHRTRGEFAAQEQAYRMALARSGNPRYLVPLAQLAADRGDLDTASRLARRAQAAQPEALAAADLLGRVLVYRDEPDSALPFLRRAVQLGSRNPDTYTMLAHYLAQTGRTREAAAVLAQGEPRLLQPDGRFACVYGRVLADLGRRDEAQRWFVQARSLPLPAPWDSLAAAGLARTAAAR